VLLAPLTQLLAHSGQIRSGPLAGKRGLGRGVASLSLWAPACTLDLFQQAYRPALESGAVERLALFTLTERAERDDHCARLYNKSLLYLVSHAFEQSPRIPLLRPDGTPQPSAWAFPGPRSALASALFVHHWTVVQSRGSRTRPVDWAQSAALLVRREAVEEIGWLDPDFFVYSDEVDLCRRLADHGWQTLYVPAAQAIHHEQLSTGSVPERRIVEMSRNRDLYMRKHHSAAAAALVRWLTAWAYAVRALAATVLPGHDPARYMAHVRATLNPASGEGLREAAEEFNRQAAAGSSPTG